jgi:hypothetical protein
VKKYRDAAARGSDCRFAGTRRRHTSGQWESAQQIAGATVAPVPRSSSSDADKSLHASGVKGSMQRRGVHQPALAAGRAASLLERTLRWRAPRAFSSVGESARLITVRSLVRIQKGPRPPHLDGRLSSPGGVAQLGEHLLCKQGVAGSSPAVSTLDLQVRHLDGIPFIDNSNRSLRSGM